eukprot:TRINITY_DN4868_c0_g1_i1.p1 TRINITY_DN4868_c0_g1~~TRINITY_DN4868_c0_g1_i1.p1  ORF type:complete len:255 (+),score=32.01 TRINITY_DN4868_c0_g1_i1:83-847(+)
MGKVDLNSNSNCSDVITQVNQGVGVPIITADITLEETSPDAKEPCPLLPDATHLLDRVCLVLDLDETLVHASFQPVEHPDMIIPLEVRGCMHHVHVKKRPFVDEFLSRVSQMFEVVVFTASLPEYADRVMDELDPYGTRIHHRLFREHCAFTNGIFVKDLLRLGRPLNRVVLIDNSPCSFLFQPRNSIHCTSWFDDELDTELRDLQPVLEDLKIEPSIFTVLDTLRQQMRRMESVGLSKLKWYRSIHSAKDDDR